MQRAIKQYGIIRKVIKRLTDDDRLHHLERHSSSLEPIRKVESQHFKKSLIGTTSDMVLRIFFGELFCQAFDCSSF